MKIVNLATVSVPTTAGGTEIFSAAAARAAIGEGMTCVVVNPSVDIYLIDPDSNGAIQSQIPGAVAGTAANSPFLCPGGAATVVLHRGNAVRGISPSGTATVRIGVGEAP